ncbi:MAG: LLM class F420-dependent oxidoreductase [Dehalococcoidia bacterium]|nr:MAG: LLM class F420-dependent oxidoreductase [Dehalococcoidia bacterium]
MTRDLHFGARLDPGLGRYAAILEHARLAERQGYDSIWVNDHVALPEVVGTDEWLECFTTLSGLAREVERVRLGTLVVAVPWRNPALVAKMAATLSDMSGGWLVLGLGAGGGEREFRRYGWPVASPADRARMVGEAAQVMRRMWTEHAPSFTGRYFEIDEAICEPRPTSPPLILIGAFGDRVGLPVAAKHADIWSLGAAGGAIEVYREKVERINRLCEANGRDPDSLRRAVNVYAIIDSSHDRAIERLDRMIAARRAQPHLRATTIAGTPEEVAERMSPYLDLGASWFITYFWEPDPAAQAENIERFATEVIPIFR